MRHLGCLIALGWFWLLFYGVGPLTSARDLTLAAVLLVAGCTAGAVWGARAARRRARATGAAVRPDARGR